MEIGFNCYFQQFGPHQLCLNSHKLVLRLSPRFYSPPVHLNNFGSTMLNYKLQIYRSENKQIDSILSWMQNNHDLNATAMLLPFFGLRCLYLLCVRNSRFKSMSIITVHYLFLEVLTTTTQRAKKKLHHLGLLSGSRLCKFCVERNDGKVKSKKRETSVIIIRFKMRSAINRFTWKMFPFSQPFLCKLMMEDESNQTGKVCCFLSFVLSPFI